MCLLLGQRCTATSSEPPRVQHTTNSTDAERCLERKAAGSEQKRNPSPGVRGALRKRLHELPSETDLKSCRACEGSCYGFPTWVSHRHLHAVTESHAASPAESAPSPHVKPTYTVSPAQSEAHYEQPTCIMVSVTCTLLYRVPSSVTHDPIVTRLQLATYSDLSSHTYSISCAVWFNITRDVTQTCRLHPQQAPPTGPTAPCELRRSSLGPGLSRPCLCLQDRHSGSTSESGGGQGAVEAERTQRKRFVLCGQVIKGSGRPSASPSPPTEEQNSSYF